MVVCLVTFGKTKLTLPYLAASLAAFDDQPPVNRLQIEIN